MLKSIVWLCAAVLWVPVAGAQEETKEEKREAGRAFLGVSLAELEEETRRTHEIPEDVKTGAVIVQVVDGSAAAKAGFKVGDVIVSFGDKKITGPEALVDAVRSREAGAAAAYSLRRGSGRITGKLTLGTVPRDLRKLEEPEMDILEEEMFPVDPEARLDKAEKRLAEMRRRLERMMDRRGRRAVPREGGVRVYSWVEREEVALAEARKRKDQKAIHRHEIRLELLREMAQKRALPSPPNRIGARVSRLERKMDEVLGLLQRVLARLAPDAGK